MIYNNSGSSGLLFTGRPQMLLICSSVIKCT